MFRSPATEASCDHLTFPFTEVNQPPNIQKPLAIASRRIFFCLRTTDVVRDTEPLSRETHPPTLPSLGLALMSVPRANIRDLPTACSSATYSSFVYY